MTDKPKDVLMIEESMKTDVFAEEVALSLKHFPPRFVTVTQSMADLGFAEGKGVIALSAGMTNEQIVTLIKAACTWSKGKAFVVVPPKPESEGTPND